MAQSDTSVFDELFNAHDDDIALEADTVLTFSNYSARDSIDSYKRSKDFSYVSNLDSLLKLAGGLKNDTISAGNTDNKKKPAIDHEDTTIPVSGPSLLSDPGVKVFLWILAGAFILFVLYKLFYSQSLFRKDKVYKPDETTDGEQPEELSDYEKNIQNALRSGNYRLAVRYLYLQSLHNLSQAGQINYAPEKTNYQYVREVFSKPYRNEFASLTLNYEYVWYGNFEIDEKTCLSLKDKFNQFNRKI